MKNEKDERLVSIILPVYNAEEYLKECIESLIKQTYQNLEIVVIDDASEDQSQTIIRKYMQVDTRFVLIEHEINLGVSKSRNDALIQASGDYIVFVDADDMVEKNFIQELVNGMGESDVCICGYSKFGRKRTDEFVLSVNEIDNDEKLLFHVLCSNYVGGYLWNKLFTRQVLTGIRFDEDLSIGEDLVFVIRCFERCNKIAYVPKLLYRYRINPLSAMRSSLSNQETNWGKLTSMEAAERVQILLIRRGKYIENCCNYRVAKTSLWVLLQMIICRRKDREILVMIKKKIKENYCGYMAISYGGTLQRSVLFMAKLNPKMLWRIGVIVNTFFPKTFQTKMIH